MMKNDNVPMKSDEILVVCPKSLEIDFKICQARRKERLKIILSPKHVAYNFYWKFQQLQSSVVGTVDEKDGGGGGGGRKVRIR